MNRVCIFWGMVVLILCLTAGNSAAALRTFSVSGTIESIDYENKELAIKTTHALVSGITPNEFALADLRENDAVVAVSLGEQGGQWVFVGKIAEDTINTLSACYGDIEFINHFNPDNADNLLNISNLQLMGDVQISYDHTPDCSLCSGCNCNASETHITIEGHEDGNSPMVLLPGKAATVFTGAYKIYVHFISGTAKAYPACLEIPCEGPQAISNFVLTIEATDQKTVSKSSSSGCFISSCGNPSVQG